MSTPESPAVPPVRSHIGAGLSLAVALAAVGLAQWQFRLGNAALGSAVEDAAGHRAAALACSALALAATVVLARRRREAPAWTARPATRRLCAAALALLVVAAAGVRFHRLRELPPGLWIDEALNGVQAVEIARRGRPLIALPPEDVRTGLGAGFVDVAALAFAWLDPDDGPYALRGVAAVIGVIGVAAAAALAWVWFGPVAAVAGAAWLTVSQWHVNFSRWGEMPIMSPAIECLVALGVTVGLRRRGVRGLAGWLVAGLALGGGLYTYQTFRLWAAAALAIGALAAWRNRNAMRGAWAPLAAGLACALLVAVPMLHYAISEPAAFGERAAGTVWFGRADWRAQLAESLPRSLLAFHYAGDDNPRHNLPFAPLLTVVPGALLLLGAATCAVRWRRPACAATLLWFVVALVPAVITLEAPHATRLLDASVPIALMLGVAVVLVADALAAALPVVGPALAGAAALAALLATAGAELHAYFVARERLPLFFDAFLPPESAPARYLAAAPPDAIVYLDPITYWHPATPFVARRFLDEPNDVRMLQVLHDFPPSTPVARDVLYLLPRDYASFAAVLAELLPATLCETWRDPFGRVDLVACRVPRDDINRLIAEAAGAAWRPPIGLRGRFWAAPEGSGAPAPVAPLVLPLLQYGIDAPPIGRFDLAEWRGVIEIPRDGDYYFRLHPDSTSLAIDGVEIIASAGERAVGGGNPGRAELRAGTHPIRITLQPGPHGQRFLWFYWQPPGEDGGWVPATALRPPPDEAAAR